MAVTENLSLTQTVTVGKAQRNLKEEDVFCEHTREEAARGCYGVFDSHGGPEAATISDQELPPHLLSLTTDAVCGHQAFPLEGIRDAFWEMDHQLGARGCYSGTTASLLLVASNDAASLCCKLAWVGDSTACMVNMAGPDAEPVCATADHKPQNVQEVERCKVEWEIREQIHELRAKREASEQSNAPADDDSFRLLFGKGVGESSASQFFSSRESFYANRKAPSREEVREALQESGKDLTDDQVRTLVLALSREKRIEAPEKRRSITSQTPLKRSNTSVLNRINVQDPSDVYGPLVLAGGELNQVSTCVTRSIGDWDGSRAMIPEPEVLTFEVAQGEHARVILCSDGVWDVLSLKDACQCARAAPTASSAADRIVQKAYTRSMQKFERLKDDTSCVVVDLNPSLLPFEKPPGAGGCCALM